jgi:uncharacterized membrane protein YgaE (UPF0421/DUF939 family)
MKRSVSKGTRNAILLGAILGVVFCATSASAPVIYGVGIVTVVIYCLLEERFLEAGGPQRRQRR